MARAERSALNAAQSRHAALLVEEERKLDNWADDLKIGLEREIREIDRLVADARRLAQVSIGNMTNEEWHRAGCVGWDWTSKGEAGLREAFQLLQTREPKAKDARHRHPGHKFSALYQWLSLKINYDDRGPIREVLRNHIINTEAVTTDRKTLGKLVRRNSLPAKQP